MEEEKKLYPFKFCTLQDDYPWGSEEFKLADLGYRDSLVREGWLAGNSLAEVMDTYLDRVVGDNVYEYYGRQFPVCVRHLRVRGRMPLRVHPDDETAAQRYDFLGKEKVWYVLRAGADARLLVGFRRDTDAAEVYAKCMDNSIEEVMNVVAPHAGQCLLIPAGTPHAACGDVEILETVSYDVTGDIIYPIAQIVNQDADEAETAAAADVLAYFTDDNAKALYDEHLFDTNVE